MAQQRCIDMLGCQCGKFTAVCVGDNAELPVLACRHPVTVIPPPSPPSSIPHITEGLAPLTAQEKDLIAKHGPVLHMQRTIQSLKKHVSKLGSLLRVFMKEVNLVRICYCEQGTCHRLLLDMLQTSGELAAGGTPPPLRRLAKQCHSGLQSSIIRTGCCVTKGNGCRIAIYKKEWMHQKKLPSMVSCELVYEFQSAWFLT